MGTGISAEKFVTISRMTTSLNLARSAGVEPTTLGFGNRYSIHLSYERVENEICMRIHQRRRSIADSAGPVHAGRFFWRQVCIKVLSLCFQNMGLMMFANPNADEIRRMLKEIRTIAVLGLSSNESRPSFQVAKGLQSKGYRIIPVRPMVAEVLGEKAYPDLESLPELPDIVDVFRASEHVPAIVESCIRLGIKRIWLQEGIVHEEAAMRAVEAGITVVMDRCLWRDCMQLCSS